MYNMPVNIIPVVLGSTGIISSRCLNFLKMIQEFSMKAVCLMFYTCLPVADPGWDVWGKCPSSPSLCRRAILLFIENTIHLVRPKSHLYYLGKHITTIFLQTHLKPKLKQLPNCHPAPSYIVSASKNNYCVDGV